MARPSKNQKATEYVHERPIAPDHLTKAQAEVWTNLFNSVVPEWIAPESFPLAAMYCQHVAQSRHIAELIAMHEASRHAQTSPAPGLIVPLPEDLASLDLAEWFKLQEKLLKALDRENRAASSLATRLRITTQALRTADNSPTGRTGTAQHAWEDEDDYAEVEE